MVFLPEPEAVQLPHKPSASLKYTYIPPSATSNLDVPSPTIVIFLNGLVLPASAWAEAITSLLTLLEGKKLPQPAILSYDRYGQHLSDPDPLDADDSERAKEGRKEGHRHDASDAVVDLDELLEYIRKTKLKEDYDDPSAASRPRIVFVGNSMGCAIARLYMQAHPGTIAGLLFLDSVVANSDFQDLWPNPDAPGYSEKDLPEGITTEDIRETRQKYKVVFHPSVVNREGLSRLNLRELLPDADNPKLQGLHGKGPWLTVVGHDWDEFARQSEVGTMKTPRIIVETYTNPWWHRYNEGLVKLTDPDRSKGPLLAPEAGHFIQKDNPTFVAKEVAEMLDKVMNDS